MYTQQIGKFWTIWKDLLSGRSIFHKRHSRSNLTVFQITKLDKFFQLIVLTLDDGGRKGGERGERS